MKLPSPVLNLLKQDQSPTAELVSQARYFEQLSSIVQAMLDTPLSNHCQLAYFDGNRMLLIADSPAWASRLRFSISTLLTQLQHYSNKFHRLSRIDIQVNPVLPTSHQPLRNERSLSDEAQRCINDCAQTVTNPDLQQALKRLATRKTPTNQ